MPKLSIDYSKAIIYKIVSNDLNIRDVYVGHTTNFIKRKAGHKTSCNNPNNKSYNLKLYQFIRANNGWDNFKMILVKTVDVENKREAEKIEREVYEELDANLNRNKPFLTDEDIKTYDREQNKKYYELNADKIKECNINNKKNKSKYDKKYYQENASQKKEKMKTIKNKI